jgi:hypothetical protein
LRIGEVFRFVRGGLGLLKGFDFFFVEVGDFLRFGCGLFAADFRAFRTGSGEEPTWEGTARAAGAGSCARNHCAATRLNIFSNVRLRLVDMFLDWRYGCGCHRAIAELRERLAGEKDVVFGRT